MSLLPSYVATAQRTPLHSTTPFPMISCIPTTSTNSKANKKDVAAICRHFTLGKCRWGLNCKFAHVNVSDVGALEEFRIRPPLNPSTTPCRHFLNGNCVMASSCRFVHNTTGEAKPVDVSPFHPITHEPRRLCRYFLDGKTCPFGIHCEYLHSVELCHAVAAPRKAMDVALKDCFEEAKVGAFLAHAQQALALLS